jgi:predicted enzyme related to lactoylglutathione lyase
MSTPVAFFEVTSNDHERAQEFYAALFGWQVAADPEMGGYGLVDTGAGEGAIGGGIGPSMAPGDTGVKIYVRVPDLQAALDRAEQLGGQALVPPTDLPAGWGRFAVLADPDGNPVGLWA